MQEKSRRVLSKQSGLHPDLAGVVDKHLAHLYRRPFADYNRSAFEQCMKVWGGTKPLILDAGCGVGESSIHLAQAYPDCFVMGVDQSADRLARDKSGLAVRCPENLVFARADLVDFWRLLVANGVRLTRHYLLYPNPWPKPHHLMRRWHGHPVFPALRELGGVIELRTNWDIYAEEFAFSVGRLMGATLRCEAFVADQPITPFERKYSASGHGLYRVVFEPGK